MGGGTRPGGAPGPPKPGGGACKRSRRHACVVLVDCVAPMVDQRGCTAPRGAPWAGEAAAEGARPPARWPGPPGSGQTRRPSGPLLLHTARLHRTRAGPPKKTGAWAAEEGEGRSGERSRCFEGLACRGACRRASSGAPLAEGTATTSGEPSHSRTTILLVVSPPAAAARAPARSCQHQHHIRRGASHQQQPSTGASHSRGAAHAAHARGRLRLREEATSRAHQHGRPVPSALPAGPAASTCASAAHRSGAAPGG